jgi:hypothetical protein
MIQCMTRDGTRNGARINESPAIGAAEFRCNRHDQDLGGGDHDKSIGAEMTTGEHYRKLVDSCMRMARECPHPEIARELQALATKYLTLANQPARPQPPPKEG